jgi:hypothetical protein
MYTGIEHTAPIQAVYFLTTLPGVSIETIEHAINYLQVKDLSAPRVE